MLGTMCYFLAATRYSRRSDVSRLPNSSDRAVFVFLSARAFIFTIMFEYKQGLEA